MADAMKGASETLDLDPPMVCRSFSGLDGCGGQARCAGAGRAAPTRTRRVRRREGRDRDVGGCLEGALQGVEPESTDVLPRARPSGTPRRARPASRAGRTAPSLARGAFGTWPDVLRGPFRTLSLDPPMFLSLVLARAVGCGWSRPLRGRRARSARRAPAGCAPAGCGGCEGRFRNMANAMKGPFRTLNDLKVPFRTWVGGAEAPLAGRDPGHRSAVSSPLLAASRRTGPPALPAAARAGRVG